MAGVSLERVDSRSELQERLRRSPRSVLLGENDEASKEFFLARISNAAIGICSQGSGVKPSSLLDEPNGEAWIGYNSIIANIDLQSCRARFELPLDCVFYSIIGQMQDGSVIVVYELGACRVSRSGQFVWNHATDVVTHFSDEGDSLHLRTDEEEVNIDKENGQSL